MITVTLFVGCDSLADPETVAESIFDAVCAAEDLDGHVVSIDDFQFGVMGE